MGSDAPKLSWDFGCLRTPAFSREHWQKWSDHAGTGDADGDRRQLRRALADWVAQPYVREALAWASPDLLSNLPVWQANPSSPRGLKIERALVRYMGRACARSTPFGLFAGVSALEVGPSTDVQLAERRAYRSQVRPSWEVLEDMCSATVRAHARDPRRIVRRNPTVHVAAGRLRCVQREGDEYRTASFEPDDTLDRILDHAQPPVSVADLISHVQAEDDELEPEDIRAFIESLLDEQLLLDELALSACGDRPLHVLVSKYHRLLGDSSLDSLHEALTQLEALPVDEQERARDEAVNHLSQAAAIDATPRHFAVVLQKPTTRRVVGEDVTGEVEKVLEFLRQLPGLRPNRKFEHFKQAFSRRFGDREVPLLVAADPSLGAYHEAGVASHPLLQGIDLQKPGGEHDAQERPQQQLEWLTRLYARAIRDDLRELELTDDDVRTVSSAPRELPESLAAKIGLFRRPGSDRVDLLFHSAYGPGAARTIGRFAHADTMLAERLREHMRGEAHAWPQAVIAELDFTPTRRLGNVVVRPHLLDYEIVCFEGSDVPDERRIPISDLWLSMRRGQLILYSRTLGRRVIPRYTSALNIALTPFSAAWILHAMQESLSLGWTWQHLTTSAPFLPRIRYGRTVVALARWNLGAGELQPFSKLSDEDWLENGAKLVQTLRAEHDWPRYVSVFEPNGSDEHMFVDLDNVLSVDSLVHQARQGRPLVVEENLLSMGEPVVTGPEGAFAHEIVLCGRSSKLNPPIELPTPSSDLFVSPGADCLYLKLYAKGAAQDRILHELSQVITRARMASCRWFFIRYADPEPHLRLRFFGAPEFLWADLLPTVQRLVSPMIASDLVWKLQIDTYERELERYGGHAGLELAEQMFALDSDAYVRVLDSFDGSIDPELRLRLGIHGLRDNLAAAGFDLERQASFCEQARDGFLDEFSLSMPARRQLSALFRSRRSDVEGWLEDASADDAIANVLLERRAAVAPVLLAISGAVSTGEMPQSFDRLLWSYNHMYVNRVMTHHPRECEMIVYDTLARHLRSRVARHEKPKAVARQAS